MKTTITITWPLHQQQNHLNSKFQVSFQSTKHQLCHQNQCHDPVASHAIKASKLCKALASPIQQPWGGFIDHLTLPPPEPLSITAIWMITHTAYLLLPYIKRKEGALRNTQQRANEPLDALLSTSYCIRFIVAFRIRNRRIYIWYHMHQKAARDEAIQFQSATSYISAMVSWLKS